MIEAPTVTQTAARLTAVIHVTIPREEIRNVMGPGIGELMTAIAEQGIAPAGPWFTHHFRMDPELFDFEIGVPVESPVTASGRVRASGWPTMKVARAVHHGEYEGLADGVGRTRRVDRGAGIHPRAGPLGVLRDGSGCERGPGLVADGAEPAADRLTRSNRRTDGPHAGTSRQWAVRRDCIAATRNSDRTHLPVRASRPPARCA